MQASHEKSKRTVRHLLGMLVVSLLFTPLGSVHGAAGPVRISRWDWEISVTPEANGLTIAYKGIPLVKGDHAGFVKYGPVIPAKSGVEIKIEDHTNSIKLIAQGKLKNGAYAKREIIITPESCFSQVEMGTPDGKLIEGKDWGVSYAVNWDAARLLDKPVKVFLSPQKSLTGTTNDKTRAILSAIATLPKTGIPWNRPLRRLEIDSGTSNLGCLRIDFNPTPLGHWGWQAFMEKNSSMLTSVSAWGWLGGFKDRWWFKITPQVTFMTPETTAMKQGIKSYRLDPCDHDVLVDYTTRKYLNGKWKARFILGTEKNPADDIGTREEWFKVDQDETDWTDLRVPAMWGAWGGEGGSRLPGKPAGVAAPLKKGERAPRYFSGICWYRSQFSLTPEDKDKRVLLYFDYVRAEATVYLNGKKVGLHVNTYNMRRPRTDESFWFDVTGFVKKEGTNLLAVRVYNPRCHNSSGGIIQPVRVETVPPVFVTTPLVAPDIQKETIKIYGHFYNKTGSSQKINLSVQIDPWQGRNALTNSGAIPTHADLGIVEIPAGESDREFEVKLRNPIAWEPGRPQLYLLKLMAKGGGLGTGDVQIGLTRFGYRAFTFAGNWFLLNGKKVFLFGHTANDLTSLYHNSDVQLNTKGFIESYLRVMRSLNHNFVRFHSMRLPDAVYDLCDELGIMVNAEFIYPASPITDDSKKRVDYIMKLEPQDVPDLPIFKETVTRWVRNLHNHPSVVTWDGGNELHQDRWEQRGESGWLADYLASWYDLVKQADKQNRPVAASSGGHIESYTKPTKTDYLDIHYAHYYCGGQEKGVEHYRGLFSEKYNRREFPFIDGEAFMEHPAFWTTMMRPWAFFKDEAGTVLDKHEYVRALRDDSKRGNWHDDWRKGIGLAGIYTAVHNWAPVYGRDIRRSLERYRMLEDKMMGYEHFFLPATDMDAALVFPYYPDKIVPQPGWEGMRDAQTPLYIAAKYPFRAHVIGGTNFEASIWILNQSLEPAEELEGTINIRGQNKESLYSRKVTVSRLQPGEVYKYALSWPIPANIVSTDAALKLELTSAGRPVCSNEYDLYILPADEAAGPLPVTKKTALYDSYGTIFAGLGGTGTSDVLDKWKIPFTPIKDFESLGSYEVLIIGYGSMDARVGEAGEKIRNWLEQGGRVVMFEQIADGIVPWLSEMRLEYIGNEITPLGIVEPQHPVFTGLSLETISCWNEDGNAAIGARFLRPLSESVLAALSSSVITGTRSCRFGMMLAEWKVGKGLAFINSCDLHRHFGSDALATKLLRQILAYTLTDAWTDKFAAPIAGAQMKIVPLSAVEIVDLAPYVTRSHIDEKADDGIGGWDDNGPSNDLRAVTAGLNFFEGFPFQIIDPGKNNGRSVILLAGGPRTNFPEKVEGIKVGKKVKALNFLQCGCYMGAKAGTVGKYIIHYQGGKTEEIPLIAGKNILDWNAPLDLPEARVAWRHTCPNFDIGLYRFRWQNPHPAEVIESIDFISTKTTGIPVLVAITGEKV